MKATKKRGRPVGSKNKPKVIKLLEKQVEEGKKQVKRVEKMIDWEKLAKNLQQALAKEIKENDRLSEGLNLASAKNAVLIKQIEFLQVMAAKVLVGVEDGHDPV